VNKPAADSTSANSSTQMGGSRGGNAPGRRGRGPGRTTCPAQLSQRGLEPAVNAVATSEQTAMHDGSIEAMLLLSTP